MRNFIAIALLTTLLSCSPAPKRHTSPGKPAPLKIGSISHSSKSKLVSDKTTDTDNIDKEIADQTQTLYIVIADTGLNYYKLDDRMKALSQMIKKPIDTMDRYYNKTKDLIALPDTSSDEIYAGDYFPRRYETETLSLEYMNLYHSSSSPKTIAIVAGIYDTQVSADSALNILKPFQHKAFAVKTSLYMGCIH